ncbi:MAG: nicotinate-nucleotide adenylyltransferase [Planctomycetota bacterium]|nr:nicotinate-nucleotide adenylyltransferase [Planctomycetota bacterium]
MRIGIYGGSFDPIHVGHLMIAETAREQLRLDRVLFLPAAQSPLKQGFRPTDAKARIDMIRLAIGGHPQFDVDEREIHRGGISYTVDTLKEITSEKRKQGDAPESSSSQDVEWFFLIGGDSLADFSRWKSPDEILRLASMAVVARGGSPELDWSVLEPYCDMNAIAKIKNNQIHMAQMEISSRDIRNRIASGKTIRYLVPPAVSAYIESKQLYR